MNNNKRFKIKAVAPTGFQYSSVRFFGIPEKQFGGGYVVEEYFTSEEEAKAYLHERITIHSHTNGSEEEIASMREDVDKHGVLDYDAVRCRIIQFN